MEERQIARGGMNQQAGPKPKKSSPTKPATPAPQNDKPKPEREPGLIPLLPATPDLTPSEQGAQRSQGQNPRNEAEEPEA